MKKFFKNTIMAIVLLATTPTFAQQDQTGDYLKKCLDSVKNYRQQRIKLQSGFEELIEMEISCLNLMVNSKDTAFKKLNDVPKMPVLVGLKKQDSILVRFIKLVEGWRKGTHAADQTEAMYSFNLDFAKQSLSRIRQSIKSIENPKATVNTIEYRNYIRYIFYYSGAYKVSTE